MNIVILRGVLSSAPVLRDLASGSRLLSLEVTTRDPEGRAASVPVAWFDPPTSAVLVEGDEVVVEGSVRRRFFRTGATTASRTEVVAVSVVPARRRKAVESVLGRTAQALGA